MPGFRAGRAPRKLVEPRFRKDVTDQVKGSLLMDSMTQVTEDQKLSAISEPDFDLAAVEVPDEGPMTFEFDIEVRPEFDLPQWKGLSDRAADARVHRRRTSTSSWSRFWPATAGWCRSTAAAASGDYITCNLTFKNGDGRALLAARKR